MSNTVSFTVSDELMSALTIESYSRDETKAATMRRIVKKYMVDAGLFSPREPTTHQQYINNPLFVSRKDANDE